MAKCSVECLVDFEVVTPETVLETHDGSGKVLSTGIRIPESVQKFTRGRVYEFGSKKQAKAFQQYHGDERMRIVK